MGGRGEGDREPGLVALGPRKAAATGGGKRGSRRGGELGRSREGA